MTENSVSGKLFSSNLVRIYFLVLFSLLFVSLIFSAYKFGQQSVSPQSPKDSSLQVTISPVAQKQLTPTPNYFDNPKLSTLEKWNQVISSNSSKDFICQDFFFSRFSQDASDFITYQSKDHQYSIDFPYNPSWGDDQNSVFPYESNPYDKMGPEILFGAPFYTDGCGYARSGLRETSPSSISQAIEKIKIDNLMLQNNPELSSDYRYSYQEVSGLKYPTLKLIEPNHFFGTTSSYKVFLPDVTLNFSWLIPESLPSLVNSIRILSL